MPNSQHPRRPEDFDAFYAGTPPLDIETPAGSPRYRGGGLLRGPSSGSGTGEHAVMAANLGLEAIGMDTAGTAIAVPKAQSSGARPLRRFPVSDALRLASLGEPFDTVPRLRTVSRFLETRIAVRSKKNITSAVRPTGRYLMLCLSERQPRDMGPRRVTQSKIRTRFGHGWRVDSIDPATIGIKSAHRSGLVEVPKPALRALSLPNMVYTTAVRQLRRDGNTEPRNRRKGRLFPCCWHPSPSACRHSRRPDSCRKLCRQESYSQTSSARRRKLQCKFQRRGGMYWPAFPTMAVRPAR